MLALALLVAGILYLDEYKDNLIKAELNALATQAEMFAVALSEAPVTELATGQYRVSEISNQMVRRLVKTTGTRARLFDGSGRMLADSRRLNGAGTSITIQELPPPADPEGLLERGLDMFDRVAGRLFGAPSYPPYHERARQHGRDYPEVVAALDGHFVKLVRALDRERLLLGVAVPVQRYKQVLGSLLLTKDSATIDAAVFETRLDILQVFAVALAVTVLLSIYLAGTIARPLRQLAAAAERVRRDHSRRHIIPDMAHRDDEIGELAATLKDMTEALWLRMDAIEAFAADVAHEIKNPLTSLRSAVETTARLKDPDQQRKLMTIIEEDVTRLDRLISDISDASRLDAELSRAETTDIDLMAMLDTLADIHNSTGASDHLVQVNGPPTGAIHVDGMESRLAQVFRNLIANAASFSPANGVISISVISENGEVQIKVEDEGPGIPAGKEQAIFERFYSQRPESEKFGTHSGLGLSISKQIIEAHDGTIVATNRTNDEGSLAGARFRVALPIAR
ncbi:MAG: HAMP domain-containing protein [Rhodospirillaceae bacterium]|nr:HAMP domain-containing protein [Rhodospirillaceae bacterium]